MIELAQVVLEKYSGRTCRARAQRGSVGVVGRGELEEGKSQKILEKIRHEEESN